MSWLSLAGRRPFKSDTTRLPSHLADCLRNVQASTVEIQGDRVVFTRRMSRFVSNWNVLAPFESGELTIDGREVRYGINFRQLILLGTMMVGVATIFMLNTPVHPPLFLLPLMWLWLVGVNLLIGIIRFERFLDRALTSASPTSRLVEVVGDNSLFSVTERVATHRA